MKKDSVFRYIDVETDCFDKKYLICNKEVNRMFEVDEFPPLEIQNWRFGFLLGSYRRENNISMKDISEKSGVDISIISKVENGKTFSEKLFQYYLSNCSNTPFDDITFIMTGDMDYMHIRYEGE